MTLPKKRNPLVSSFLSLLVPGLGQLYNGEPKKGILFFVAQFAFLIPLFILGLQYTPGGLFIILSLFVVFYFLVMSEATIRSFIKKTVVLKSYNKWYVYILVILLANGISGSFKTVFKQNLIGIKPVYLPSASNEPTLMTGDYIIVDLRKKTPKKGTFIVFTSPDDPETNFMKRVIATQGDLLEIRHKKVYVNNTLLIEPYSVHGDTKIVSEKSSPRDNYGPAHIPSGKVFVMGDNRDYSFDSRFFGPIDKKTIIGTALYIYWSKDKQRMGMIVDSHAG